MRFCTLLIFLVTLACLPACRYAYGSMMETAQVNTDLHGLHVNEVAKALREEYTLMAGRPGEDTVHDNTIHGSTVYDNTVRLSSTTAAAASR